MREKIKVLFYGDMVVPSGFSRVLHSIIEYLPKEEFNISALGLGYKGDPHNFPFKIYPAESRGSVWGFNRIKEVMEIEDPDILFILNDIWVITKILDEIKDAKKLPQIITYFPVDSEGYDRNWFNNFGFVAKPVVYTEFGKKVVEDCGANVNLTIVPHGTDSKTFYKLDKREARDRVYSRQPEFKDCFIVLNANRNQPRKRIDVYLEAFGIFAKDKPDVRTYLHMGLRDMGWDIQKLTKRFALGKNRVVVSAPTMRMQAISDTKLNDIYNATDLGVNTSTGEGFGLTNVEHAVTGAPQIVGNHSACAELFGDCGLLVDPVLKLTTPGEGVIASYVSPEAVAEKMNLIYNNKELYAELADKCYKKFTAPEYSWENISYTWSEIFKELV